ncbi:Homeobox protein tos8 [Mitosporidium daphniae]|uniref:Homeobox domain-containing protein n=1 Tax=Mitosporidium daphniae TaxID=1485682 RepID=A0A098VU75_9MICR|nr:uncharacterized protein DI09_143p10 [Mitosporidium daphniae]KGG52683.1 hypothetical protein DI09_143p10 [Mitosporidium daphniae]|eukprot:XP_013239119.1 uncharacterized protein DI09_143p10 [Mitosporidium daphniae]
MSSKTTNLLLDIWQKFISLRQKVFANSHTNSQDDIILLNEYRNLFNQTTAGVEISEYDRQLIEAIIRYSENLQKSIVAKGEFLMKRADILFVFQSKISAIINESIPLDTLEIERSHIPKQMGYPEKHINPNSTSSLKFSKRSNYPKNVTFVLKNWLENNTNHPYPDEEQKVKLSRQTGLCLTQINNWFINARRRILPDLTEKRSIR